MQIHMENVNSTQANAFRMSMFSGAYKTLKTVLTRTVSRTASEATSSPTTKLFCDKWRPAGIELLLTDRHQWAALGCQANNLQ